MKKQKLLLLMLGLISLSIVWAVDNTPIKKQDSSQIYGGDTVTTTLKGDSVKYSTDKTKYCFDKPISVKGKVLATENALTNFVTLNTPQTITRGKVITSLSEPALDLRTGTSENIALIATSNSTMPTLFIGNANDEGLAAQIGGNIDITGLVTYNSGTDTAATKAFADAVPYTKNYPSLYTASKKVIGSINETYVNRNVVSPALPYVYGDSVPNMIRMISGSMAGSDIFRIYGEGTANQGKVVFEAGDDGDEQFLFSLRTIYSGARTALGSISGAGVLFPNRVGQFSVVKIGANDSAATKAELRAKTVDLSKYVTLNTAQSVLGKKYFTDTITAGNGLRVKNIGYLDSLIIRSENGRAVSKLNSDGGQTQVYLGSNSNYANTNGVGSMSIGKITGENSYSEINGDASMANIKIQNAESYILSGGDNSYLNVKIEADSSHVASGSGVTYIKAKISGNNSYVQNDNEGTYTNAFIESRDSYIRNGAINGYINAKLSGANSHVESNGEGATIIGKVEGNNSYITSNMDISITAGKIGGVNSYIDNTGELSDIRCKINGTNAYAQSSADNNTIIGKLGSDGGHLSNNGEAATLIARVDGNNSYADLSGDGAFMLTKIQTPDSHISATENMGFTYAYLEYGERNTENTGKAAWCVGDSMHINSNYSYNFGRAYTTNVNDSNTFNVGFSKKELTVKKDSIKIGVPIYSKSNITTTGNIYAANIPKIAYGQIYVTDGTATQSIPSGTTYTKLTLFTDTLNDDGHYSTNITVSATNDNLTAKVAGSYLITTRFAGTVTSSTRIYAVLFRTRSGVATELHHTEGVYKYGSTSDVLSTPCGGIVHLNVGDSLDFRIRHTNGSAITYTGEQLAIIATLIKAD